jgi:hypothetical protein
MSEKVSDHSIKSAKALCRIYMEKGVPTYTSGPPGVGKSDMWRQLAKEKGINIIDIRLANKLPEDIGGIPVPDQQRNVAKWLRAEFWPEEKRDGKEGILFFDEMTDANKALQSCAYQIVLDRKINEYKLPDGWYPCAAGNRRIDRASAQSLSSALANRFAHITVRADALAWHEWAMSDPGMGHLVPAFIKYRPNLLHSMEGTDLTAFPTPRSWANVAKVIGNGDGCPTELRLSLVEGLVGLAPAGEFESFMKVLDLPSIEDVEAAPKKCRIPKQPASKYAMTCMLARYAGRKNFSKIWEYIQRDEFGRDFQICTMLDATRRDPSLCETQPFVDFANANTDLQL